MAVSLTDKGKFQKGTKFVEGLSVEDMMANIQGETFHHHKGDLRKHNDSQTHLPISAHFPNEIRIRLLSPLLFR